MWTSSELKNLEKILTDDTIDSYVDTDELKIIGSAAKNLRNYNYIPKHNQKVCFPSFSQILILTQHKTVRIQKICPRDKMDMSEWLTAIGDCIRFQSLICWISVSYLMTDKEGEKIYHHDAKSRAFTMVKLRTKVYSQNHTVCDIIHSLNGMPLSRSSLVVLTNSISWNDRSMLLMTIRSKLPDSTHTKLSLTTVISGNKLKLGPKRVGHLNQNNRFWKRYLYVCFVLTV